MRWPTVVALGLAQTLAWASSYYLAAIVAPPMARELGTTPAVAFAAFSASLVAAAIAGPYAGRAIDRWGGRPVLLSSNFVFAAGLVWLGLAQDAASMFLAWAVIGIAMAAGLYEAAFAALVRLWGTSARGAITGITLIAGFASTVGWPLTALFEATWGWRSACFGWALLHIILGLPLNGLLPRVVAGMVGQPHANSGDGVETVHATSSQAAWLLSFVFAATWFISTAMAAHLPRLMQLSGATLAAAVFVGALVGPAQVLARIAEFGLLRRAHPLLSARAASLMHPIGAACLVAFGAPAGVAFGLLHGAGNGILTIAKGTLPLVLFGPQGYGHRQGLLMVPARVAQALAPWLFGLALDRWGNLALIISMTLGVMVFGALLMLARPRDAE